jgi:hypothetical protein
MKRFAGVLIVCASALVAGCGGHHMLTDSQSQARQSANDQQKVADDLRRAGAAEAAAKAQHRADQYEAQASRRPGSFVEWLADVLFTSLLTPVSGPPGPKR